MKKKKSEIVKSLGVSFDLSPRQKAVVECLRAPRAQNFLTVIPIEGLGQHMSALEYRTILKYRLMIPLFPVDEPCPVCRKVCLDSFGEHAGHCKELHGFKYRHDLVRDVLYDVLKRAGISSRKEAPVNFLTDPLEGRSTLRPADILVFGWAGGKHACVDLTGVSPLVGLRDNGFVAGQAALKAESSKVAKHEKACLENQHVFIPFAFDTFGFLAPEAEEFLNRVKVAPPIEQKYHVSSMPSEIPKRLDPETSFMAHIPKPPPPPPKPKPKPKRKKKKKIKITWSSPNYHGRYPLTNDEQKVWNKFTMNDTTKANSFECYPIENLVTVKDDMVVDLLGKFAVDTFNKSCHMYVNKDEDNKVSGAEFMECKFYKLTKEYIFYMTIEAIEQGIPGVYTTKVECKTENGARTLLNFRLTDCKPKFTLYN
ncbi:hypothetical protein Tco_1051235 [Tanacetum coccineum]